MDLQQLIGWTFQLSIVAAAFGCGLKATTADVSDSMRQPGPLGRSLLAMFVIVPVVAVALVHAFDFPQGAEVALIALAISPLAALIPGNLIKAGRRPSCAVAPMATVALLSIAIVPLLAALIGRFLGPPFVISPWRVAGVIAAAVLLPLVAGMVIRGLRPALADRMALPAALLGTVVLRLATLALLVTSLHAIWALIANGTVIAVAVLVVVGFAAGHLLGRPEPDGRTVLALASGFRHPAVALAIAAVGASNPHFAAAIVLYLLLGDIVGLPYAIWRQRSRDQPTDAEAAAVILAAREKAVDDIRAEQAAPYYVAPPAQPTSSQGAPVPPSTNGGNAAKRSRQ
jgi:bile acid:Na+ symporter, BASS family